jgi:beta-glucosidase
VTDRADALTFPDGFVWGVATSSYQIEGAVDADGRGPSIWDTFCAQPGRVRGGESGAVACDHYHRWEADLDLLADLGVGAYRFSVAWPRVVPAGTGRVEPRGLDFYDRLVDGLLARGIAATPTLYHWDLPQPLEDAGGWLARDTAKAFADYAAVVAERLGDRVDTWWTVNEPAVSAVLGYAIGVHAPGHSLLGGSFPATHHLLLGHGLAMQAVRAAVPGATVGAVLNLSPAEPADPASEADVLAAAQFDRVWNRLYLDPLLRGAYPGDGGPPIPGADPSCVRDGDLAIISGPLDRFGVNYYQPQRVAAAAPGDSLGFTLAAYDGVATTQLGWPVLPDRLTSLLVGLRADYGDRLPPIVITENGCAVADEPSPDGAVHDPFRVDFLDGHLRALHAAIAAGVDVRGYDVWSFLDNFEWAEGYAPRFGIVHVDYETQARLPKDSFAWYRSLVTQAR